MKPVRILLVDDDEDDFVMTRDLIDEIPGSTFEIDWASTYEAAVAQLTETTHDIYFFDYNLGARTGLQLLEEAVAMGCAAPIVLLTGQQDREIDVAAAKAGAFDYLIKGEADATLIERTIRYSIERKLAEEEVRRNREILQKIIHHIPHSVFWKDADSRYIGCNDNFAHYLGLEDSSQVVGKFDEELQSEGCAAASAALDRKVIESGHPIINREETYQATCGDERTHLISRTAVTGEDGAIVGTLGMFVDITDTKQAERERELMEEQLQQAQRLESIGRLAAGIAHEINTPTQYIGDNVHFLRDAFRDIGEFSAMSLNVLQSAAEGRVPTEDVEKVQTEAAKIDLDFLLEEIPDAVDQTLEGIGSVARIVRAMKEFSHPGSGSHDQVDINRAVETTISVSKNEWKYCAEIETDLDPTNPIVPLYAGDFNQAMLNIVVNAAHAIQDSGRDQDAKGTITISTKTDGEFAEVAIRDNGGGIPTEAQGQIFDPFFTTKDVGRGTGQGLAIAYSAVVDKHGGTLTFETERGVGTAFFIRVPMSPQKTTPTDHGDEPTESK